jgi:hypothetical protein
MYATLEEPEISESLLEEMICIAYQKDKIFCVGSLLLELANLMTRSQNTATAAHAYVAAAKIHAKLGSQLREKSEAAFFSFKQSHSDLDALVLQLTNQDWRALVRSLISK